MGADFQLAQGDRSPSIRATLLHADRATPLDLTGAESVFFAMKPRNGGPPLLTAACEIVDAPAGVVQYDWQAGDTATPGNFRGEFVATLADGRVRTWPEPNYVSISIKPRLA